MERERNWETEERRRLLWWNAVIIGPMAALTAFLAVLAWLT